MPRVVVRRLTITPIGATVAFIASLLIALGAISGSGSLAQAGVALLAVIASMHLYARLSLITLARETAITRSLPDPVEGHIFQVRLVVENTGFAPLIIEVEDRPPEGVDPLDQPRASLMVLPGARASAIYKAVSRLGTRCFKPARIKGWDILGLFEYVVEARVAGECIRVRPSLEATPEKIVSELMLHGEGAPRLLHRGLEVYQLREYVEGDDAKLIEWKATARSGRLIVKQTLAEVMGRAVVYLIVDSRGYRGEWMNTPLERAARIVARSVRDLLAQGFKVKLVLHTPSYRGSVEGDTPQSIWRFLDLLSRIDPNAGVFTEPPEVGGDAALVVVAGPNGVKARGGTRIVEVGGDAG